MDCSLGRDRAALIGARSSLLAAALPTVFLTVFVLWPVIAIGRRSFGGSDLGQLFETLARPSIRRVIWFTVVQAVVSTAVTLAVGLPVAQILARYQFRGRQVLRSIVVVPFVLPTVVVAAAFTALFDRFGFASTRSFGAIIAAHVFFNVAVVVRIVGGYWATIDRRPMESARVLGAGRVQAFRAVTLPQLAPVLAAAAVVVFLFSFTSFGIIQILGGPGRATLETEIFRYAVRRIEFDVAAALAVLQLIVVLVLAGASASFQRRVSRVQRGRARPLAIPVTTRWHRLHLLAGLVLVAAVVFAPLVVLVEGSLATGDGYGFGNYERLFQSGDLLPVSAAEAIWHSILFAGVAAAVASVVGLSAAVAVVGGGRIGRWLETLSLAPLGISAVTLGFGYLVGFTVFDLRRSIWLVPLAHAVIGLPFVLAAVVPALRSIDPRLGEAAATLGADRMAVRRFIEWPAVRRAALTGAGFAAAVSIGEFGATSFLSRGADSFTAPLAIARLVSQPGAALRGQALALSVVVGALVAVVAAVIEARRGTGVSLL